MHLIKRVTEARTDLVKLVGVAIVIGVGVNLVSGAIASFLDPIAAACVGAAIAVLVVLIVAVAQLRSLRETVTFHGVIPMIKNEIVAIRRYDLTEHLARAMDAVLGENAALARQWQNDPITLARVEGESGKDLRNIEGAGATLLREALEHVYLDLLSDHLNDYFSDGPLQGLIQHHVRSDLLPLLPDNRVLDVLSSPLENRIALVDAENNGHGNHFVRVMRKTIHDDGREEEVLVMASDGQVMFQRLELALPKGVSVQRLSPGHVRLDSRILRTDLVVDFSGYGTVLDSEFIERYMGLPAGEFYGRGDGSGALWKVDFKFISSVKWLGVFTLRGWRLHRWAESFAESIEKSVDKKAFLHAIGWETARTVLMAHPRQRKDSGDDKTLEDESVAIPATEPQPATPKLNQQEQ